MVCVGQGLEGEREGVGEADAGVGYGGEEKREEVEVELGQRVAAKEAASGGRSGWRRRPRTWARKEWMRSMCVCVCVCVWSVG